MADKKSFLIHKDSLHVLDELTDIEAGKLFKAIACYQYGEEIELDTLTKITFAPFKSQFNRDNEKYLKTCESRAASGSKGGLAKASKGKQKVAKPSKPKQNLANLADSVNERDSDKDSDNEKERDRKELAIVKKKAFAKPALEDIQSYFHELGSNTCLDDGERFRDHFDSNGWKVGGKTAMKDWKASIRSWHKRNKDKTNDRSSKNKTALANLTDTDF